MTKELAELFFEYRYNPKNLFKKLPFSQLTLTKLRNKLGIDYFADLNKWFAARIDDLIGMKPAAFLKKYEPQLKWYAIYGVRTPIKAILAMVESRSAEDVKLLALLEKDCSMESKASRKALDKHYGPDISKRIIRAYRILKIAKKI